MFTSQQHLIAKTKDRW